MKLLMSWDLEISLCKEVLLLGGAATIISVCPGWTDFWCQLIGKASLAM